MRMLWESERGPSAVHAVTVSVSSAESAERLRERRQSHESRHAVAEEAEVEGSCGDRPRVDPARSDLFYHHWRAKMASGTPSMGSYNA
jgi:hypothetical protein